MIKPVTLQDLKQFDLFSQLADKTIQKYLPYFYYREYKKNQYLFMEGDPRDRIYFLLDGYVMYEKCSEEGSKIYIEFLKNHEMLPYSGLFADSYYQHNAIAVTDIRVLFIQTHILESFLKTNPRQLINIISKLSAIINLHEKRVQQVVIPSAHDRVLQSLQLLIDDLGEKDGEEIVIPCPLTASNISRLSGTTRETVSVLINQLKRENVISVDSKRIRVHSPDYIKKSS